MPQAQTEKMEAFMFYRVTNLNSTGQATLFSIQFNIFEKQKINIIILIINFEINNNF